MSELYLLHYFHFLYSTCPLLVLCRLLLICLCVSSNEPHPGRAMVCFNAVSLASMLSNKSLGKHRWMSECPCVTLGSVLFILLYLKEDSNYIHPPGVTPSRRPLWLSSVFIWLRTPPFMFPHHLYLYITRLLALTKVYWLTLSIHLDSGFLESNPWDKGDPREQE